MPIPSQANEITVGFHSWTKDVGGMVSTCVAEVVRTEGTVEYIKVSKEALNELMQEAGWTLVDDKDPAQE
jgi:hypothetical protein